MILWVICKIIKYIKPVKYTKNIENIKNIKIFYGSLWVMNIFLYYFSVVYLVVLPSPTLVKRPNFNNKAKSLLLVSLVAPVIS